MESRRLDPQPQAQPETRLPGQPGNLQLATPEGEDIGETRQNTPRRAEDAEATGQPAGSTSARAGRCSRAGRPTKLHRESTRRRRGFGATRKIDSTVDKRCEIRCAPKITSPVKAGRHSSGATRKNVRRQNWYSEGSGQPGFFKARTAEGCESRGNSAIHRRYGLKMQQRGDSLPHQRRSRRTEEPARTGKSPQAALQGATSGKPGGSAPGLNGRCMV